LFKEGFKIALAPQDAKLGESGKPLFAPSYTTADGEFRQGLNWSLTAQRKGASRWRSAHLYIIKADEVTENCALTQELKLSDPSITTSAAVELGKKILEEFHAQFKGDPTRKPRQQQEPGDEFFFNCEPTTLRM
jgi:hypothetical protein